jgi:hypothetical protein
MSRYCSLVSYLLIATTHAREIPELSIIAAPFGLLDLWLCACHGDLCPYASSDHSEDHRKIAVAMNTLFIAPIFQSDANKHYEDIVTEEVWAGFLMARTRKRLRRPGSAPTSPVNWPDS